MATIKINDTTTYPNTAPALTDHVPGTDVSNTTNDAAGETVTFTMQAIMDLFEANFAAAASAITSGTFADARISETSVTQHEAALSVASTQLSDSTAAGRSMLTAADAAAQTALLNNFTTALKGLAPASGGGTTNFLRADGTWAAPPGSAVAAIDDLTDVTISAPADNEVLAYDNATSEWINQTAAEAGLAAASHSHEGTAILSTGEVGGTKFLREDGDGTCSWQTISGGGDALTANPLSQFAATTSLQLKGVISDETGSGALVFATSPTLVTPVLGTPTSGTLTNCTGLPSTGISDSTAAGRTLLTAADAAAQRTALNVSNGATNWTDVVNGDIIPDADGTRDLGNSTTRFAILHVDQIDLAGTSLDGTSIPLTDVVSFIIDGGGSTITTGVKGFVEVPFACTISAVRLLADQSGSIVVDIWKDTYANYPPSDTESITASAVPTISAAVKSEDTTLTGWTTAISAGDILGFNVDSATTVTRVTVSLTVTL